MACIPRGANLNLNMFFTSDADIYYFPDEHVFLKCERVFYRFLLSCQPTPMTSSSL